MLPHKLKFRDSLTIVTSSPTKMQLRSGEAEVLIIRGNAVATLIPAIITELDGSRPWPEVIDKLVHIASPDVIEACIQQLFQQGVLVEGATDSAHLREGDEVLFRFFSHPPFVPTEILRKVRSANIGTFCEGALEGRLTRHLHKHGFQQCTSFSYSLAQLEMTSQQIDFLIVMVPHMEASTLDDINRLSLTMGMPWLPVDLYSGPFCAFGPLIVPGNGPCYQCYRSRLRSNLGMHLDAYDDFLDFQRRNRTRVSHYGMLPGGIDIAFGFICLEALKVVTRFQPPACLGHNLLLDLSTLDIQRHRVLQLPRCPSCSQSDEVAKGHWTM